MRLHNSRYVTEVSSSLVFSPLPTPPPPSPAVGKTGQHNLLECGTDLDQAKQLFTKKYATLEGRERGKEEMRGKGGEGGKGKEGEYFYRRKSIVSTI